MLTSYDRYVALGKTSELRESAYRKLFQTDIPDMDIDAICLGKVRISLLSLSLSEKSSNKARL
jgi:hypothetical protein